MECYDSRLYGKAEENEKAMKGKSVSPFASMPDASVPIVFVSPVTLILYA
jgi:hypothetical protein